MSGESARVAEARTLVCLLGDLDLPEGAMQESFAAALESSPSRARSSFQRHASGPSIGGFLRLKKRHEHKNLERLGLSS